MPYWKEKVASLQDKPLILLDIDGVINGRSHGRTAMHWEDKTRAYAGERELDYSPSVIKSINRWDSSNQAEIRWLTGWNENAQALAAPAVGLNYFALARNNTMAQELSRNFPKISKSKAAIDCLSQTPTRRLVWIDDEVHDHAPKIDFTIRPNTLLVSCSTRQGCRLTDDDIKCIDQFLEL
jgi:hypothetical protein